MKKVFLLLMVWICITSGYIAASTGDHPATEPAEVKVDYTIPEDVAMAALKAYKAEDVNTLMILSRPDIAERIKKMIDAGKLEDIKKRSFDKTKWRSKSVAAWDGKLHETKKRGEKIRIRYGNIGANEVAVVELANVDGKWYFEDLKSPSLQGWQNWGKNK
ncbi:MAG: hypothetical protein ABFR75_14865 [Acidobacteriota bacterium]